MMRAGPTILILTVLLCLLAGAGWYAYVGLPASGEQLPSDYYLSLAIGAIAAVVVGVGLMALVFYSSRRGYDEPPHFHRDG